MSELLVAHGTPRSFDAFLRPVIRAVQLFLGLVGTAALAWFELWWWAPLPLALSFVAYEWFFWSRGDRPVVLTLAPDHVTLDDPRRGARVRVDRDRIESATFFHRPAVDGDGIEVVVALAGLDDALLALPFRIGEAEHRPGPHDVDAGAADAVLGGLAGIVRAVAPGDRVCRQVFHDARALAWLRANLPADVQARTAVRVWRGREPSLDLFGYHDVPADGFLRLAPDEIALRPHPKAPDRTRITSRTGTPGHAALARSSRTAVLFTMHGEEHAELQEDLGMLVMDLEPVGRIAIPAPAVDPSLPEVDLDDDVLHVHGPEGAALLWFVARHGRVGPLSAELAAILPRPAPAP